MKGTVALFAIAASTAATPAPTTATPARLPGFAAELSEMPVIAGPGAWNVIPRFEAWARLVRAKTGARQSARWAYARSLIGSNRASEALGVLDVMRQDDPDLALVPSWQIARGAALAQLRRSAEALAALSGDALGANPEACLWRMRTMAEAGLAEQALMQAGCASPAINARPAAGRSPFLAAASRAAIEVGKPALALQWLRLALDRDPAANLYRGRAYLALGDQQAGRLRLNRVGVSGNAEQRMDARLSKVEAGVAAGTMSRPAAMKELGQITFNWRGDSIEERALRLAARISAEAHDLNRSLGAGAALVRYFDLGKDTGPILSGLRQQLTAALAPDSKMPIQQAAGLYWDYRDLTPSGAEGDLLVNRLADRLQAVGLHARAAELLHYQLTARAKDIAQGPLSAKVASLYILAGRPDRALRALRATDKIAYPETMLWDRRRVEAAALHLLGKTPEALAVLQDVPDGDLIRAEILWKKRDWTGLASAGEPVLPSADAMSELEQAMVLRHAIALAMLGREDGLAVLRARYGSAFAKLPTAATFDALTGATGATNSAVISTAMAALPSASPAGAIADLLDAVPKSAPLR